jgi:hypothetical protein
LQYSIFYYKLDYYKSGLFLATGGGCVERSLIRNFLTRVVFFWQEVNFEQAKIFDRVFWREVFARCSGIDFIADNNSLASDSVAGK